MKWEYMTQLLRGGESDEVAKLNRLGAEGWELVAVLMYPFEQRAYFKRQVK